MRQIVLTIAVLQISVMSYGASKYDLHYLVNGAKVTSESAIQSAIKGVTVHKCQTVEAKVSKSGTSISLQNVKKPKDN